EFRRLAKKTLTMRTARGYQYVLADGDPGETAEFVDTVKAAYRDYSDENDKPHLQVWSGERYVLVPMSITCTRDHGQVGDQSHPPPDRVCHGQNHDYSVREWFDVNKQPIPIARAKEILL